MYTDLRTLEPGTRFYVKNGDWTGFIFDRSGKKFMHIDFTGRDKELTGKEDLIISIVKRPK